MSKIGTVLSRFISERRGITSVEYALLLALITGAILASVIALNSAVSGKMDDSATCIESDNPESDCD